MNYCFEVNNEKISNRPGMKLYTGNIDTYTFSFNFNENWENLLKFVSFSKDSEIYIIKMENDTITVPHEVLNSPGICTFGVYGTNADDNIKRISSNILEFEVTKGAYSDGISPETPTPDIWETLFRKSVPKIMDGNWYIYSIDENDYVNTGIMPVGTIPVKGIDYFTEKEKDELVQAITEKTTGDIETCLDNIISIQNKLIGGEGV